MEHLKSSIHIKYTPLIAQTRTAAHISFEMRYCDPHCKRIAQPSQPQATLLLTKKRQAAPVTLPSECMLIYSNMEHDE